MQRNQKIEINIFGNYIGYTTCQVIRITHFAQVAYLQYRLEQQDYENGILVMKLVRNGNRTKKVR